jgi:hypothetical protein
MCSRDGASVFAIAGRSAVAVGAHGGGYALGSGRPPGACEQWRWYRSRYPFIILF